MSESAQEPFSLRLYRAASAVAGPFAEFALRRRMSKGKEDPRRIAERRGIPSLERPPGRVIWIHGASVGESLSVLPLVARFRSLRPDYAILVTTGTTTSADLMRERLPDGAFHQYVPLDHPRFVASFLDHWRPDAAFFVESEFWPNLILETRRRTPFLALVNGRVSPRSFEEWRRKPDAICYVLSAFDIMLAQDRENAERLAILSDRNVDMLGNLKNAAPPLPAEAVALEALKREIGARPIWLAASTHPGEDAPLFAAHRMLRETFPELLTLLAPRHPQRGAALWRAAIEQGFRPSLRSLDQRIRPETDIYVADTLGELGLFYRLSEISFVGGSLIAKGGHNPLEPARLGGAILHGPHVFNFSEIYGDLRKAGGAALVRNERELATATRRLLSDAKTQSAMAGAARAAADERAERVLLDVSALLLARLDAMQSRAA
jgi:3-deoxy-D-manno-octulosonic-acid transferase